MRCGLLRGDSCRRDEHGAGRSGPETAAPARIHFEDVTRAAGIHFVHNNGSFGQKWLPETMGSGVAFLDYDNDGWQDILIVNGMDWPGHVRHRSTLALYHNNHDGTFTDVTAKAGPRRRNVRNGRGHRRLQQRRLRRHLRYRGGAEPSFSQQRQWHVHRRDEAGRALGAERVQHGRRMGGLRSRRPSRPRRRELRAVVAHRRHLLHHGRKDEIVLHAGILQRHLPPALAQPRRRNL